MADLALTYLGGCPGHDRREPVQIAVFDDRFELRARAWGWRIAFGSVLRLGDLQPAPDGDGQIVPVVWTADTDPRTLMLSGRDAGRLRFLLAQARIMASREPERVEPPSPAIVRRPPGPWQRELRRMRTVTAIGLAVAMAALVIVFGVTLVVVGSSARRGHWASDRVLLSERSADVDSAQARNDSAALSLALQALQDECRRLEGFNGDGENQGDDFAEAQRVCASVGVALF